MNQQLTIDRDVLQAALKLIIEANTSGFLWKGNAEASDCVQNLRAILAVPSYSWECNACGAQEYTMAVSENDVHLLACGRCGSDEWHKEIAR